MSKLFSLGKNDYIKGLVVTVLGAVISLVLEVLKSGAAIDWQNVGMAALVAGLSYIVKQLGTDENGKLGGKIDVTSKP